MTRNEFYEHICNLEKSFQNRDLEIYLLALLKLVEREKAQDLTADLLLQILQDAFATEPAVFSPNWLNKTKAPGGIFENNETANSKSGLEYSIAVLQFQISELYKMREKQLKNEMRYFGVYSETGNCWYNFDPMTNLECGTRSFLDGEENNDVEFDVAWHTLGELLEMGRIYE